MRPRRLTRVGKIPDQLECNDRSDSRAVPLMPATDATDSLPNKSEGNTFAIVVNPAYVKVTSCEQET